MQSLKCRKLCNLWTIVIEKINKKLINFRKIDKNFKTKFDRKTDRNLKLLVEILLLKVLMQQNNLKLMAKKLLETVLTGLFFRIAIMFIVFSV